MKSQKKKRKRNNSVEATAYLYQDVKTNGE